MNSIFTITFLLLANLALSQTTFDYAPSEAHPFGQPNPNAPDQIKDYAPMIGKSKCQSSSRNADGTWAEPVEMIWTFKYIMNGMAVQDETLKSNGAHSGSIRQYSTDSSRWYVHWYSGTAPSTVLPVWEGNMDKDNIVLYREQPAPNGLEGQHRLTFYDLSEAGFKWVGEWIDNANTIVYPTWRITCDGKL
jgi:hypothetical protein